MVDGAQVSLGTAAPCSCTIAAANAFEGVIVSVIFVIPSITGAAWAPLRGAAGGRTNKRIRVTRLVALDAPVVGVLDQVRVRVDLENSGTLAMIQLLGQIAM